MPELKLKSLSPSTVNHIRGCPRKWLYTKLNLCQVQVDERYAIFGGVVHKLIASYYNMIGQNPSPELIRIQAEKVFGRWYKPEIKMMKRRATDIKKNFIEYELTRRKTWRYYKPTYVEKKLNVKPWVDLPEFHPVIDFYSEPEKTIIDWKTGTVEMNEGTMLQGKVYEIAMRAIGKPVDHVLFVALKQGLPYEMPKVNDGWVYKLCRDTMDIVESGKFPKKPTALCGWCPFMLRCEFDYHSLWDVF